MLPVLVMNAKVVHLATVNFERFALNRELGPLGLQAQFVAIFLFVLVMVQVFRFWVVWMVLTRVLPDVICSSGFICIFSIYKKFSKI